MPSMPHRVRDDQDDNSAAEEIVLGVDTHTDRHVAAVLTTLGTRLNSASFAATAAGYRELMAWVGTFGVLRWSTRRRRSRRAGSIKRPGQRQREGR